MIALSLPLKEPKNFQDKNTRPILCIECIKNIGGHSMQRKKNSFTFNISTLRPYLPFLVFALIFILGVFLGSILVCRLDSLNTVSTDKLSEMIAVKKSADFLQMFKASLLSILPFYFLLYICGTSVIGTATTPIILLYKGFTYGCLSGLLYSTYKLEGIMFAALILLPQTLITVFGLLLLAKESFAFSYLLGGICIKSSKPVNIYSDFKSYCVNSGLCLITGFLAIGFDLGMSSLFISYFNF